tara:strand:- start:3040 stop:4008 length:969 start_codon:yes stop_codon:yes gene_type:complete
MGWSVLVVPKHLSLAQRRRVIGAWRPDVLFVQQSRHPLNRVEYLGDIPFLYDLDDADFVDPEFEASMQALARQADAVICGSRHIRDWAAQYSSRTEVVWTGTPLPPDSRFIPAHTERKPLVVWAQTNPAKYLAELAFVTEVMEQVAASRPGTALRLYDWREAEDDPRLERLRRAGVSLELLPAMPYDLFLESLGDTAVGLSAIRTVTPFSRGKSFGKVLGYLSARTPVICSDEADHACLFDNSSGVVSNDAAVWVAAILRLIDDPAAREAIADAADVKFRANLTTEVAAQSISSILETVLASRRPKPDVARAASSLGSQEGT